MISLLLNFYLIILISSDVDGKCASLFRKNFDVCKTDETFKNTDEKDDKGFSIRSECATMAPFAMPVGWKDYKSDDIKYAYYTTHDPNIVPEKDQLNSHCENNILSECKEGEPRNISDVYTKGNHKKFHKWCPMYDYNLRKNDDSFQNRKTCCFHASDKVFVTDNIDATYVAGNFEIFQKHNLYQVYPKCYDLLRYMPCMVCDPNIQDPDYIFQVGKKKPDGYSVEIPVYTYRLCDYYATEIWNQCRRAFYLTNGRKLVVPKDMGLEQFKEMVGVPKSTDQKCFNLSDVNPFYED